MSVDNSGSNPFPRASTEANSSLTAEPESGDGGGDLTAWQNSNYAALLVGSYTNASSYTIPTGYFNVNARSFPQESTKQPAEPPTSYRIGENLGTEMAVWGATRETRLRKLTTSTYTNASSYTLPAGFVDSLQFPLGFESGEKGIAEPPRGAKLGANYFDLLIRGTVAASPPGFEDTNPVPITDATLVAEKDGVTYTSSPKGDGTYDLSVGDYGTWTVTATRDYLSDATIEVEVASPTEQNRDLYMRFPSSGLSVAEGVRLG